MNTIAPAIRRKRGRRPDKVLAALRASLLKIIGDHRFDDITARDIIIDSGVSPATFYRHYRSKMALLEAVADEEIETLVSMSTTFHTSTWETSLAQIRHFDDNRALWSVLLNGGAAGYVREGFIQRLALEYSDERWRSETWLPNDLAIRFSVSAMVEIISWWLRQEVPQPIETIAEMLEGLTVQPTLPENAPARRRRPPAAEPCPRSRS
jgi:AcrR family transcriptional regulator